MERRAVFIYTPRCLDEESPVPPSPTSSLKAVFGASRPASYAASQCPTIASECSVISPFMPDGSGYSSEASSLPMSGPEEGYDPETPGRSKMSRWDAIRHGLTPHSSSSNTPALTISSPRALKPSKSAFLQSPPALSPQSSCRSNKRLTITAEPRVFVEQQAQANVRKHSTGKKPKPTRASKRSAAPGSASLPL